MRSPLVALSFSLASACGSTTSATAPAARAGGGERAGYTVHEWGLVRGGPSDTLAALAVGPMPPDEVMVVLKPILYFHLEDAAHPVAIRTSRVTAVEGDIREHFPVTTETPLPTAIDWGALEVTSGACSAPFVTPRLDEPPCSLVPAGETCEAAMLGVALSPDADCLVRSGEPAPFLFYRSSTRGLTVPLRGVRLPNGDLEITNDGDLAIPGRLVRIARSGGEARIVTVDPPAPHATITIPVTGSGDDGAAAIGASLRELGLTEGEIAAFHGAWDATLFGRVALDMTLALPTLEESIVYFLPPALCERIATIELDPPPTELRRAMAVWTAI